MYGDLLPGVAVVGHTRIVTILIVGWALEVEVAECGVDSVGVSPGAVGLAAGGIFDNKYGFAFGHKGVSHSVAFVVFKTLF